MALWRKISAAAGVSIACAAVAMSGCASPDATGTGADVIGPSPATFVGNQGGAWEVLFAPGADQPAGVEAATRRDVALNRRDPEPITALGMWPDAPTPSLGHARRLFLPRRADDVLYLRGYGPHQPIRRHHHHRIWY